MTDEKIPDEYCGPAMMALKTDARRLFCFYVGGGLMNGAEAARAAGYSDGNKGEGAKRRAYMLLQQEDVMAAVQEVRSYAGNWVMTK